MLFTEHTVCHSLSVIGAASIVACVSEDVLVFEMPGI